MPAETLHPFDEGSMRDIFEVANQIAGYVDPGTPEDLAQFLMREAGEAKKLADIIVGLRTERDETATRLSAVIAERDAEAKIAKAYKAEWALWVDRSSVFLARAEKAQADLDEMRKALELRSPDLERSVMACATLEDLRSVQITIQRIHEEEAIAFEEQRKAFVERIRASDPLRRWSK